MQKQIAVVVSGFPRRSETFAVNELIALEERGDASEHLLDHAASSARRACSVTRTA